MTFKRFVIYAFQALIRPKFLLKRNRIPISTRVMKNAYINHSEFGHYGYVASNTVINFCKIGDYCSIAPGVQIGGMEHPYWEFATNTLLTDACVKGKITTIGHDVWVGAGAIIKQGVNIGTGAVIGANSFVNKDVAPYSIVVGTPARILKTRFDENVQKALLLSRYWEYSPQKARKMLNALKFELTKNEEK